MSRFGYPVHQQPSRVTFGTGSVRHLADGVLDQRTVVFATGQSHLHALVDASLGKKGDRLSQAQVLTKPAGEPSREMVEMGARFLRDRAFDRIVGIGGGLVLDWCRLSRARQGRARPQLRPHPRPRHHGDPAASLAHPYDVRDGSRGRWCGGLC